MQEFCTVNDSSLILYVRYRSIAYFQKAKLSFSDSQAELHTVYRGNSRFVVHPDGCSVVTLKTRPHLKAFKKNIPNCRDKNFSAILVYLSNLYTGKVLWKRIRA